MRARRDLTHRFYRMDGFPVVKDSLSRPIAAARSCTRQGEYFGII
jgi:hypothetical protein